MKAYSLIVVIILLTNTLYAQPPQQPMLPKQDIAKPVATIKTYPALSQYLYQGSWKADVWWTTPEAGHSSTIPDIRFTLNNEAIWQSPFPEIVASQPGIVRINGDDISISFDYTPYKYLLKGVYNKNLGKITGTFTQTRMKILNAPVGYTSGVTSGTFSMLKK